MSGFIAERMNAARVWRLVAAASLIIASLAIAYSIGRAQAASPPEIEACVNKFTGVARMSPNGGALNCQPHETLRTWNAIGAPGSAGQDGQDGVDGQDGQDGQDGVAGYEIVSEVKSLTGETNVLLGDVVCPAGKKVIGGGLSLSQNTWNVLLSAPGSVANPASDNAWSVLVKGPSLLPIGTEIVEIEAICVNVSE